MEYGGRTPEDRRAAAEARARARRGEPPAAGDEELLESAGPRGAEGQMSRYGGSMDVYLRRRLLALAAVIVLVIAIFLLVGGC